MHQFAEHPDQSDHHVRRVVLPSGRAIEVVYFDAADEVEADAHASAVERAGEQLHVCPCCDESLVYPVEWQEVDATHWEVALRCPNCEWNKTGRYDQLCVDRFDEELDRGTEALVRDLRRLTRANMEEEVERFIAALTADAIWPMDF